MNDALTCIDALVALDNAELIGRRQVTTTGINAERDASACSHEIAELHSKIAQMNESYNEKFAQMHVSNQHLRQTIAHLTKMVASLTSFQPPAITPMNQTPTQLDLTHSVPTQPAIPQRVHIHQSPVPPEFIQPAHVPKLIDSKRAAPDTVAERPPASKLLRLEPATQVIAPNAPATAGTDAVGDDSVATQALVATRREIVGGRVEINFAETGWKMTAKELRIAFAGHTDPSLASEQRRSIYFRLINLPRHDTKYRGWKCIRPYCRVGVTIAAPTYMLPTLKWVASDIVSRAPRQQTLLPAPAKRRLMPKNVRMDVWSKFMGKVWEGDCVVCGRVIDCTEFHVGHVVAHARGGTDHVDNLRPICAPCNTSMGTQDLDEYRKMYYGH